MIGFKLNNFIKRSLRDLGLNVRKTTKRQLLEAYLKRSFPVTTNVNLIRIGDNTDGGYLVPDDLNEIEACFSPGVAQAASFEQGMIHRGIKCYLADYSVEGPPIVHQDIEFEKKFIGLDNNHVYMTLENWVNRNNKDSSKDLILQMDIEGSEYDVIMNVSEKVLKKFRIIIIEFHGLDTISDPFGFRIIDSTFRKLLNDFVLVHIHPNNISKPVKIRDFLIPPTMEFTFLRKDRVTSYHDTTTFPHQLDFTCISAKEDFKLPDCWYRHEN